MRCGLATCPHGSASLAVWRTDAIFRYSRSQPSQGKELEASYPGAQWSARGRNIKLPLLTPADVGYKTALRVQSRIVMVHHRS